MSANLMSAIRLINQCYFVMHKMNLILAKLYKFKWYLYNVKAGPKTEILPLCEKTKLELYF